ncbi:hypothetical protein CVO96_06920 [Deinococcus koreensis]|uniref:Uncharacterized protein n=1 Tax=Deinococcus koreensis TaxID=2054903 RepID=A0A2K3UXA6_9DEIO|nr:hypothetical protein CVO96_06920 [Deinococcus koreensis]
MAASGIVCAAVVAALATLTALVLHRHLTSDIVAQALDWGGIALCFLAGAIAYSQTALGRGEAQMRARLGQTYRLPTLPFDQVIAALIGAAVLFLVEFVLRHA